MKKFLFLIVLLFTYSFQAQNNEEKADDFQNMIGRSSKAGMWIPSAKPDTTIEGSVYLFPIWEQLFKIELTNKMNIKLYNLNYNIQQKTLESKISKDSVYQFNIKNFDKIKLINSSYKVINGSLFQEIYIGEKIKCYKDFDVSIKSGVFNPLTQTMTTLAKYVKNVHYFYILNEEMIEFKPNKKNILKVLTNKKVEIESEIKKKKYDLENDNDLKLLFQFYESL